MDTLTAIRKQRAVRQYAEQDVSDDQVMAVLDAGRRSGSSKNTQPWQYIVVRDAQQRAALAQCGAYAAHLLSAPVAIVVVMPSDSFWSGVDGGRTAQNMMLAATSLGLGTCIATLHNLDCARQTLGLPANLYPNLTFSLGVPASPAPAPQERAFMQRVLPQAGRRPLAELVHFERWGQQQSS